MDILDWRRSVTAASFDRPPANTLHCGDIPAAATLIDLPPTEGDKHCMIDLISDEKAHAPHLYHQRNPPPLATVPDSAEGDPFLLDHAALSHAWRPRQVPCPSSSNSGSTRSLLFYTDLRDAQPDPVHDSDEPVSTKPAGSPRQQRPGRNPASAARATDREPAPPASPGRDPYQRRLRAKTRPDRYTVKEDKRRQKRVSTDSIQPATRQPRGHHKVTRQHPTAAQNAFALAPRLTLPPSARASGIFRHGKASAPRRGNAGVLDLTFPEASFLAHSEERPHSNLSARHYQHLQARRQRLQDTAQHDEISIFFTGTRPPLAERDGNRALTPAAIEHAPQQHPCPKTCPSGSSVRPYQLVLDERGPSAYHAVVPDALGSGPRSTDRSTRHRIVLSHCHDRASPTTVEEHGHGDFHQHQGSLRDNVHHQHRKSNRPRDAVSQKKRNHQEIDVVPWPAARVQTEHVQLEGINSENSPSEWSLLLRQCDQARLQTSPSVSLRQDSHRVRDGEEQPPQISRRRPRHSSARVRFLDPLSDETIYTRDVHRSCRKHPDELPSSPRLISG